MENNIEKKERSVKYIILTHPNPVTLSQEVGEYLSKGWTIVGSPLFGEDPMVGKVWAQGVKK